MKTRMRHNAGFTLIEVMISIAATAMIALAIYSGTSQTNKTQDIVNYSQRHYHEVRIAFDLMSRDLASTYLSNFVGTGDAHQTVFVGSDDGNGDSIDFYAFSHTRRYFDANESDQAELSYYVARDPEYDYMNLVRRESAILDDDPFEGGQHMVVVHNIEEFQVEYYDISLKEWQDEWDTTQATGEGTILPTQVRIKLVVNERQGVGKLDPSDNEYRQVTYATQIPIPMRTPIRNNWFVPPLQ